MPLFSGPQFPQLQNGRKWKGELRKLYGLPSLDGEERAYVGLAVGAGYPSRLLIYPGEESQIGTAASRTGYRGRRPPMVSLQGRRPSSELLWALDS